MEATENTAAVYQEWEVLTVRDMGCSVRLHGAQGRSFGTVKAVFLPLEIGWLPVWRYTVKAVSSQVLLTADSLPDLPQRAPELIKYLGSCVWAVNMAKIPFEGVGPEPVAVGVEGDLVIMVLNKNPCGVELPLWRLSCNFTRTDGGLDLAPDDQGTPAHVVGGSSNPMGARPAA